MLNSKDTEVNKMEIEIDYKSNIDMSLRRIDIYMSASMLNNPIVKFLHDLLEHKHLIRKFKLNIHYVLGQCRKCREKNFMTKEKGCLSGGRYCVIDTGYRQNELVKETLRQICLRTNYSSEAVISYLWDMKQSINRSMREGKWQTKDLEMFSWNTMKLAKIDIKKIQKCYNESFKLVGAEGRSGLTADDENNKVDPELDENILLAEEQKQFFEITQYNVLPLIKINNVYYDENINIRWVGGGPNWPETLCASAAKTGSSIAECSASCAKSSFWF